MTPHNVNPAQWQQNVGFAREACAQVFRDGGTPADAMKAFGLDATAMALDWSVVVDRIAQSLAHARTDARAMKKAA